MSEFNLDLAVLRLLKSRAKYERYHSMIPSGTVNKETAKLIMRFGQFFDSTDAEHLTHAEFWPFLRTFYPKWKPKDIEFWDAATRPIDQDNALGLDEQIVRNLLATDLSNKALALIEKWNNGDEVELSEQLRQAVEAYDSAVTRKVKSADVVLEWDAMIDDEANGRGLTMRLECLNNVMKPLDEGAFGIFAMRPDRGKTTMVAAEITWWAPQLVDLYPDEFRPVLWLNNEGPGRRILARIRQSALGMSASEIRALGADKARKAYIKAIGGREDMIQVVDIHGWSSWDVEELVRKKRPGAVVFDMIDNIHFTGGLANNGERNDQVLEAMYQWARVLGVKYGFVGAATSQISAEGEGNRWPLQTQLKDSRTGKQGACDFIITGGFDPSMPHTRFIGMTKNKLKREGANASPDCQVTFDADRGRLNMPTME